MSIVIPWSEAGRRGAYTTSQVARLVGCSTPNVASWLRGSEPIIVPDYSPADGRQVISFQGLLEARMIAHMIREGVPLRQLRSVMARLRAHTQEQHPLARDQAFVTDGFRIFQSDGESLINLANDCYAEPELMKPALQGRVVFQGDRAAYYQPSPRDLPNVRIDPRIAFGRPVVVEGKNAVPTSKLAETVATDGADGAASWFELSPNAIRQAVEFEERLAA